jgi:hypothetical protein
MLVRLTQANFDFSQARPDGQDLRFSDEGGNRLFFYVESWDAVNKRADVWVRKSRIEGNSDKNYITMYWGRTDAAVASNSGEVFRQDEGMRGFWLFDEAANATLGFPVKDASNGGRHAAGYNLRAGRDGVASTGFNFDGDADYVALPLAATSGLKKFTFTLWMRSTLARNTSGNVPTSSAWKPRTSRSAISASA